MSDCEDLEVINQLDGLNVQPRIVGRFTGGISLSTVTPQSVFLVEAESSQPRSSRRIPLNQLQWDLPTHTLMGAPDALLQQHHRYLLVVTDDIRDASGVRIESTPFWAPAINGPLSETDRRYANALKKAVRAAGLKPEHLAAARLLRLAGAIVPCSFAERFRKYFGPQKLPRP